MQFTKENAEKVMAGTKTQTRRIVEDGEEGLVYNLTPDGKIKNYSTVIIISQGYPKGRIKWQVGRIYAVQSGRGKPAVGHVKLLEIRKQRLQDISTLDCVAELGCPAVWTGPGPEPYKRDLRNAFAELWDSIATLGNWWENNLDVWALTLEVVK